jgi:hypothetical protein
VTKSLKDLHSSEIRDDWLEFDMSLYRNDGSHCQICMRPFQNMEYVYSAKTPEFNSICRRCVESIDPSELEGVTINEPYIYGGV